MLSKTLVIGGKGKTGRHIVKKLKDRGLKYCIATRSPKSEDELYFDWMDKKNAQLVFKGFDKIYIVAPTNNSDHKTIVLPILKAAKKSGVNRFVLLSASSLEMGGPMMGQVHDWIAKNTQEWSILRPTWFMQNFSEQQHQITIRDESAVYSSTENGTVGFIDVVDIAEVAVKALTAKKAWNSDFILTGPELLSYTDITKKLTTVIGKNIKHKNLRENELINRFKSLGFDHSYAKILTGMDVHISKGSEAKLTNNVENLTGRKPKSFENFATLNKHRWE